MWQQSLKSGWGMLFASILVALLAVSDLTFTQWRVVIVTTLLATSVMIWHKRLRHFVLLPSCIAFASGMLLIITNLNR